jgi:hypothetical protein
LLTSVPRPETLYAYCIGEEEEEEGKIDRLKLDIRMDSRARSY